jgi:hypothetical protein
MKKLLSRTLPLLLCAITLLTSCAKAPKMTYADGVFTVDGMGVRFEAAPAYYEAKAYAESRPVARLEQGDMDDLIFYEIDGISPEKMISSANHELFCAAGTKLPELWEMSAVRAYVCQTASVTYSLATVEGDKALASLIDPYQNGVSFLAKEIEAGLSMTKYDLKFESPLYPGIYYCLTYWQFNRDVLIYQDIEDPNAFTALYPGVEVTVKPYEKAEDGYYAEYNFGKYILHNRTTGKCWPIGDTVAVLLDTQEK